MSEEKSDDTKSGDGEITIKKNTKIIFELDYLSYEPKYDSGSNTLTIKPKVAEAKSSANGNAENKNEKPETKGDTKIDEKPETNGDTKIEKPEADTKVENTPADDKLSTKDGGSYSRRTRKNRNQRRNRRSRKIFI